MPGPPQAVGATASRVTGPALLAGTAVLAGCALLAGCASREPQPAPAPSTRVTTTARPARPATPTTSARPLPGMPTPRSVGPSAVDDGRIRSAADLPAAFQCPSAVTPITIPPSTPSGTATAKPVPGAIVCASHLADDEALYLWYYASPEEKLAALTAAMASTKYVHAGPNWVAGGTVGARMGTVGGEVYR